MIFCNLPTPADAVNKRNSRFKFNTGGVEDGDEGSKWSLAALRAWMTNNGHSFEAMWARIGDIAVRTVISIQPLLSHTYKSMVTPENDGFSCFEVLGLDIMLDSKLRPWLIEVNHSPSFTVDTPLDSSIKEALIADTLRLVRVDGRLIRKAQRAEREMAKARLYSGQFRAKAGGEKGPDELAAAKAQVLSVRGRCGGCAGPWKDSLGCPPPTRARHVGLLTKAAGSVESLAFCNSSRVRLSSQKPLFSPRPPCRTAPNSNRRFSGPPGTSASTRATTQQRMGCTDLSCRRARHFQLSGESERGSRLLTSHGHLNRPVGRREVMEALIDGCTWAQRVAGGLTLKRVPP